MCENCLVKDTPICDTCWRNDKNNNNKQPKKGELQKRRRETRSKRHVKDSTELSGGHLW